MRIDGELKIVARRNRWLADGAGRDLQVLFADGAHDVAGGEVARGKPLGVEPDAHRVVARS